MPCARLEGPPPAVRVHEEAGTGKTTLVRSACEQAKDDGAQVMWGHSLLRPGRHLPSG